MYFVVTWDIGAHHPTWSEINERLRACLADCKSFKACNTFYMVKIEAAPQWKAILKAFQEVTASVEPISVRLVMSPPLTITGWDGWLPPEEWPTNVDPIVE